MPHLCPGSLLVEVSSCAMLAMGSCHVVLVHHAAAAEGAHECSSSHAHLLRLNVHSRSCCPDELTEFGQQATLLQCLALPQAGIGRRWRHGGREESCRVHAGWAMCLISRMFFHFDV